MSCSGFEWTELLWPALTACCNAHDAGGTNGALLDCIEAVVPAWAYPIGAVFVVLMIWVRPIYRVLKRLFTRT